jgi:hypothetical protein
MNDLSEIGLLKREFRDVHSVVSRLDQQVRRLVEPVAMRRPGGAARRRCAHIARAEAPSGRCREATFPRRL